MPKVLENVPSNISSHQIIPMSAPAGATRLPVNHGVMHQETFEEGKNEGLTTASAANVYLMQQYGAALVDGDQIDPHNNTYYVGSALSASGYGGSSTAGAEVLQQLKITDTSLLNPHARNQGIDTKPLSSQSQNPLHDSTSQQF